MKKSFSFSVIMSMLLVAAMVSCKPSGKQKSQETSVEVESFDVVKIKDQIVEIIQTFPPTGDVINMLNKAGASYILDLTLPADQAEKTISSAKQAFALGMYTFDLQYANIYQRSDKAVESSTLAREMIRKLGIESEMASPEKFIDRIKNNADNKDSVNYLVSRMLNHVNSKFATGDHPDVFAYAATGGNIEGLHVICQLTQLASNKEELLLVLSQQKERVNILFSLLELMSNDENIKPVYEGMKPIVTLFNENTSITASHIDEISPAIEKIRNSMLQ